MTSLQRMTVLALVAVAVGFGALWGMRSAPPTETEIIDRAAAAYVAETGGMLTDCAARPASVDGVRVVVSCADGVWVAAYDTRGRRLDDADLAAVAGSGT